MIVKTVITYSDSDDNHNWQQWDLDLLQSMGVAQNDKAERYSKQWWLVIMLKYEEVVIVKQ